MCNSFSGLYPVFCTQVNHVLKSASPRGDLGLVSPIALVCGSFSPLRAVTGLTMLYGECLSCALDPHSGVSELRV